jgi:hypothetical protein
VREKREARGERETRDAFGDFCLETKAMSQIELRNLHKHKVGVPQSQERPVKSAHP